MSRMTSFAKKLVFISVRIFFDEYKKFFVWISIRNFCPLENCFVLDKYVKLFLENSDFGKYKDILDISFLSENKNYFRSLYFG